jgi:hypothetical protein
MNKIIRIPGHGPVEIYSDTDMFISIPGNGPIEISEVPVSGLPDYAWVSSAGGDYWVSTPGGDYWVSTV